jgi:hypothetical protein
MAKRSRRAASESTGLWRHPPPTRRTPTRHDPAAKYLPTALQGIGPPQYWESNHPVHSRRSRANICPLESRHKLSMEEQEAPRPIEGRQSARSSPRRRALRKLAETNSQELWPERTSASHSKCDHCLNQSFASLTHQIVSRRSLFKRKTMRNQRL